jgi:hypothetical protein
MSDFFGLALSEPNLHMMNRMMDLYNGKLIKNNGTKITQNVIENAKTEQLLEGKWTKFIINYDYGKLSTLHICFRNVNNKMLIEYSMDFELMSCINDVLHISSDAFIQTVKTDTGVKQDFEIRDKINICAEEMIFTVNHQKRKAMMSEKGHICFSEIAQQHDWNFEETGASGFHSGFDSPINVGRLADQLHQTILGSTRRSLFRNPSTSTPGKGQQKSPVPQFNPNLPPPNFPPRRRTHLYDTIDTTTSEGSEDVEKQRRKPKKQRGEKSKEEEQNCEYSFVFKKNPVSKQEKVIKALIENLNDLRKKKPEDADETLTKAGFEELAKSIFQPLEDLNLELNDNAETPNSQSPDATVIHEDDSQLEEIQTVVTRSKTKEQNDKNQEEEEWH